MKDTCTDLPITLPLIIGWTCRWWVWSLYADTGDVQCDPPRSTFRKWVPQTGIWHTFDNTNDPPWRTLCGKHETSDSETKTPGGRECRECMDIEGLPADHHRRQWST